jgi:flagellar motor switch protein FliM
VFDSELIFQWWTTLFGGDGRFSTSGQAEISHQAQHNVKQIVGHDAGKYGNTWNRCTHSFEYIDTFRNACQAQPISWSLTKMVVSPPFK